MKFWDWSMNPKKLKNGLSLKVFMRVATRILFIQDLKILILNLVKLKLKFKSNKRFYKVN